jgi:hypothetical protein
VESIGSCGGPIYMWRFSENVVHSPLFNQHHLLSTCRRPSEVCRGGAAALVSFARVDQVNRQTASEPLALDHCLASGQARWSYGRAKTFSVLSPTELDFANGPVRKPAAQTSGKQELKALATNIDHCPGGLLPRHRIPWFPRRRLNGRVSF